MGPQQVLRAAALVAVTAVSAATVSAQPLPATSEAPAASSPTSTSTATASATTAARPVPALARAPIVVVDLNLRGGAGGSGSGAAALRQELRTAGFSVISSPELDAANAGIDGGKDLGEALAALVLAKASFGALDCPAAQVAAESAIARLAARGAAGIEVATPLTSAWSYLLLCRDRSGDFDGAMRAAAALRTLTAQAALAAGAASAAAAPPATIDATVWAKYPEVDATGNHDVAELAISIASDQGTDLDAAIAIDHRPAGTSPVKVFVPVGRHLIAAARGSRRAALWIDLSTRAASVALRLSEQDAPLSRISERVAGWKTQPPDGSRVATYFENLLAAAQGQSWNPSSARSPLLVILGVAGDPRRAQLWASDGPGALPEVTELSFDPQAPGALLAAVQRRASIWNEQAAEPDPLLTGTADGERQRESKSGGQKWWVYAALAGAVVVGGGVILANELSEDTQRVELRW